MILSHTEFPATYEDFIEAIKNCDAETDKLDPGIIRYYDEETHEYMAKAIVSKRWGTSSCMYVVK